MTTSTQTGWKRYSLWIFVALAYLITWVVWLPVARYAAQYDYLLPDPGTLPELIANGLEDATHVRLVLLTTISILFSGPLLAAVIVLAFESGKKGVRDLWHRSTHWRIGWRWYGIMLAIILLISLPAFIVGLVRGPLPTASQVWTILIWFVPVFIYTFFASGLEEPGWRGYALPNLQTRHSAKKASAILAVIWGIWHWPVFIPVYTSALDSPGGVPQAVITLLIQLTLYILGSMWSGALIYTWLYNRTGSVFLCILFHTLHNNAWTYLAMLFPSTTSIIPILGMISEWIVAIALMRFFWVEAQTTDA
jgi:membrane protease YdiL (CAAX protease family)